MKKKNTIILFVGCGESKERVQLFNFTKMDHILIDGRAYVRVECDGKYYYYPTQLTAISEVYIYETDK